MNEYPIAMRTREEVVDSLTTIIMMGGRSFFAAERDAEKIVSEIEAISRATSGRDVATIINEVKVYEKATDQ